MSNRCNLTRRSEAPLTRLYVIALAIIAGYIIASQIWVQQTLIELEKNASILNVSGRQRMLSQKISKSILAVSAGGEPQKYRREISIALSEWKAADERLRRSASAQQNEIFAAIDPSIERITRIAKAMQEPGFKLTNGDRNQLLKEEEIFLRGMEKIVALNEDGAIQKTQFRHTELLLAAIALIILTLEALLIFRPLARLIRRQINEITVSRDELAGAKVSLERASEFKSKFISYLSHEIRNPLTAIGGYTDLMLKTPTNEIERSEYLGIVKRSCGHLTQLCHDVLDMCQVESGNLSIRKTEVCPKSIVTEVADLLRPVVEKKSLFIESFFQGNLPARIWSDEIRIRQILINLVTNAIKATQSGGIQLLVNAPSQRDIAFEVVDSGRGMSAEQVSRLFRYFSQVHKPSTETASDGYGIGLAISAQLSRLLNGSLSVKSSPGMGSSVTLTLQGVS